MVKAVQNNNQAEVTRLCMAGEEVTGTYGMGDTLMHWAVSKMSRSETTIIVQLFSQCCRCDCELMEYLWTGGAPIGQENGNGATPLRIAIRNNHRKLANCLIAMGEILPITSFS